MSEMLETAFILAQATEKSLVVVDEVGENSTLYNISLLCTTESITNTKFTDNLQELTA